MAKINKYWGYVAIGALTAAAAGAVAAADPVPSSTVTSYTLPFTVMV